jgi:hypothetical protein
MGISFHVERTYRARDPNVPERVGPAAGERIERWPGRRHPKRDRTELRMLLPPWREARRRRRAAQLEARPAAAPCSRPQAKTDFGAIHLSGGGRKTGSSPQDSITDSHNPYWKSVSLLFSEKSRPRRATSARHLRGSSTCAPRHRGSLACKNRSLLRGEPEPNPPGAAAN